jgi:hypothetical protein
MLEELFLLVSLIKSLLKNQAELALENLALRQQRWLRLFGQLPKGIKCNLA